MESTNLLKNIGEYNFGEIKLIPWFTVDTTIMNLNSPRFDSPNTSRNLDFSCHFVSMVKFSVVFLKFINQ